MCPSKAPFLPFPPKFLQPPVLPITLLLIFFLVYKLFLTLTYLLLLNTLIYIFIDPFLFANLIDILFMNEIFSSISVYSDLFDSLFGVFKEIAISIYVFGSLMPILLLYFKFVWG